MRFRVEGYGSMISAIAFSLALVQGAGSAPGQQGLPIVVGWNDELDSRAHWSPLNVENKARVSGPPGVLLLSLGQVPTGWPYEYQWSGVSQDLRVDLARFPVLMAKVNWVQGYAHLDIDVVDAAGVAVKTFRSSTLTAAGLSTVDLGKELDPAYYSLRIRLIVGGPNSGCEATYDWVRFVSRRDSEFLTAHPEWDLVRPVWRVSRRPVVPPTDRT